MDDSIQEAMLRCIHVPSITAVGPIVTEKLAKQKKKNLTSQWTVKYVTVKYGPLRSRGHANMYASAKYHCCRTNIY